MQLTAGMILCNIPGICLLIYFSRKALKETIPGKTLCALIITGILLMVPVVGLQTVIGSYADTGFLKAHPILSEFVMSAIRLALTEEFCKFIGTIVISWRGKYFNKEIHAVLMPAILALSFGIFENLMFMLLSFSTMQSRFWLVVLTRAFIGAPGHGAYGIIMGKSYWKAKEASLQGASGRTIGFCCLAVLVPSCIHGLYDWLASSQFVKIGNTDIVTGIMVALDLVVIIAAYWSVLRRLKTNAS